MGILERNNVKASGRGAQGVIFAHGFGCDQNMWRFVEPAFRDEYRTVLFDHVGAGKSDVTQYSREKYGTLQGYAGDLIEICDALQLTGAIFVGHSVSAMIGILAAGRRPELFEKLILIGPSPCYVNDQDYVGGFSRADIDGLLSLLERNFLGWSSTMAPAIMGNPDRPELAEELGESFCRTDPDIAQHFARVTFLSDNRADLLPVTTPALILQCSDDAIAPVAVGQYVNRTLVNSRFVQMRATGHCPNLSAPEETIAAIKDYLATV